MLLSGWMSVLRIRSYACEFDWGMDDKKVIIVSRPQEYNSRFIWLGETAPDNTHTMEHNF